jgi:L-cysteine/cystine lyase
MQTSFTVPAPGREQSIDCSRARRAYPTLERSAYFNYGAAGPLSVNALDAICRAYGFLANCGPFSIEANLWVEEEVAVTRSLLEAELDAPAGTIAFADSICAACNIVLWGIEWLAGDHIVISASENAGVAAAVQTVAERFSLKVSQVAVSRCTIEDPISQIARVLRPETRLVILSHILQPTGEAMPIAQIRQLCRSQQGSGPMLLVDGAQAAGAVPVSLQSLDPDFYAFTGSKWLCGPGGLAGLHIRSDRLELLRPSSVGWRNLLAERTGMAGLYAGARRFDIGVSAYPLYTGLRAAIELHARAADIGERTRRMLEMTRYFRRGLLTLSRQIPIRFIPDDTECGTASGIVSFAIGGCRPAELVQFLEARQILIREIDDPQCARVCIHYLTTAEEIDHLVEAIDAFLVRRRI